MFRITTDPLYFAILDFVKSNETVNSIRTPKVTLKVHMDIPSLISRAKNYEIQERSG